MKSKIIVFLFAIISIYVSMQLRHRLGNMYISDMAGYYVFLPSICIYHDLDRPSFHNAEDRYAEYYLLEQPNGRKVNKYTFVISLMELPFFLIAQSFALNSNYEADGYSYPYQLAGIISSAFWVMLGLFALRRLLRNYFNDTVVAITLACIGFGTNLFHYTVYDPGMSHSYSFTLFCFVFHFTDAWYKKQKLKYLVFLSLSFSLLVVLRPVNIMMGLIPLLWGVYNKDSFQQRLVTLKNQLRQILLGICLFMVFPIVQMAYWKYTSGHFYVNLYPNEHFDFLHPNIWKGLFSFRKGWFIYTPMAFLALMGFYFLFKKYRQFVPALVFLLTIAIYVCFSWEAWWYGGSFGCRALVEYLSVLVMPFAALTDHIVTRSKKIAVILFITIACLFVALNQFQSFQFSYGIIHWDRMTAAYYFKVFGKTEPDPDYEKYLLPEDEYWEERLKAHPGK